jgi:5'(3')-deoxyribonucleotidase
MTEPFDDLLTGLRIGIDMDGVLADFYGGWMERYNREHGTDLGVADVTFWDGLHRLTRFETMDEFWEWIGDEEPTVFRYAPPLPGALEAVRRIARSHRIVIVSSKFDWSIPDSLGWLADHEVPAREVHFLWDKTLVECDVYLDDAPHVLEELRAGRPEATICRVVQPWNDPVPGVIDVYSWADFEHIVENVARAKGAGRIAD